MAAAAAPAGAEDGGAASAASSSEYSSEEDDETWEERAWRLLINKASFSGWEYPRARPPYREYAPQIPFFPHLGGVGPRWLQVWLPQTLVFGLGADPGSGGAQQAWLSCDADGCIQRRDEFDPDADVMPVFQSPDPEAIVAIFKRLTPQGVAQKQLLTSYELGEVVFNRQSYGLFMIQAFVPPRKGRATLSRSVWHRERGGGGHAHFVYAISNKQRFADTRRTGDLCLNLSEYNSATVTKLRGVAVEELEALTDAVAIYIQRGLGVVVNDLVADFTKDDQGRWWLLQVKAFRLEVHRGRNANQRIAEFLKRDSGESLVDYSHLDKSWGSLKSTTTLHLRGHNRDTAESDIGWDGGEAEAKEFRRLWDVGGEASFKEVRQRLGKGAEAWCKEGSIGTLVRKHPQYKLSAPPTLPGKPLTQLDTEAMSACKWCSTRCRTSHLQCTMSLKMIADVQRHMQQRGASTQAVKTNPCDSH